jgi:hypothetical protein
MGRHLNGISAFQNYFLLMFFITEEQDHVAEADCSMRWYLWCFFNFGFCHVNNCQVFRVMEQLNLWLGFTMYLILCAIKFQFLLLFRLLGCLGSIKLWFLKWLLPGAPRLHDISHSPPCYTKSCISQPGYSSLLPIPTISLPEVSFIHPSAFWVFLFSFLVFQFCLFAWLFW